MATALWPVLRPVRARFERAHDGSGLRPGITAVIAARNEDYTIGFCLQSLIGIADQIVCIDNGSDDATLAEMKRFRDEHGDEVDVNVVSMPGALLGDCRNEALRRTRHQWHLRWDADMVARTSGPESMLAVRDRLLADDRPRAINMSRINLSGDLHHMPRLGPVVDHGENWLLRFGRGIEYREAGGESGGKYDRVRPPLHQLEVREHGHHIIHLATLKSDENLMHRFHYFAWRDAVNREGTALDAELRTLEGFTRRRNLELFGTVDPRALKFRYQRQLSYHLTRFDVDRFGEYPEVLKPALTGEPRFEVLYRDGRPWTRIDRENEEMRDYEPTADDLEWDPEAFLRRFLTDSQCREVGIATEDQTQIQPSDRTA